MKGLDKLKKASRNATKKLPKPLRKKADKKLGLFIHKYVATLYYFDDEVNNLYRKMEEQAEKGYIKEAPEDEKSVFELSDEMKMVLQLRNDKESAFYRRRHDRMRKTVSEKLEDKADLIENIASKNPRGLYKSVKQIMKNKESREDMEEAFQDLEQENHE